MPEYKNYKQALIGTVKKLSDNTKVYGPIDLSGADNPDGMTPDECADYIIRLHAVYRDAINTLDRENLDLRTQVEHYKESYQDMVKKDHEREHYAPIFGKINEKLTKARKAVIEFNERMRNNAEV